MLHVLLVPADGCVEAASTGAGAGGRGGGHHARQRGEGAREGPETLRAGQARRRPPGGRLAVSAAGRQQTMSTTHY